MESFESNSIAIVFGSSGGIGSSLVSILKNEHHFKKVLGFSRDSKVPMDLCNEDSIKEAVTCAAEIGEIRLAIDATGFLHDAKQGPEKTWRDLTPEMLTNSFKINTIGPAIIMKHVLPHLPRKGKSVFASLSARVGSIGDNRLGGWYGYRASKAGLNQLVRTASIELAMRRPEAICVSLHPGTVLTPLSKPFISNHKENAFSAVASANYILDVIDKLRIRDTGGFFDWQGKSIPW